MWGGGGGDEKALKTKLFNNVLSIDCRSRYNLINEERKFSMSAVLLKIMQIKKIF